MPKHRDMVGLAGKDRGKSEAGKTAQALLKARAFCLKDEEPANIIELVIRINCVFFLWSI